MAPLFVRQVAPLVDNIDDDLFGVIERPRRTHARARAHTNGKPPEGRQWEEEGSVKTSPTFANMDSLTFIEFAKTLTRLKMYPYFDVANYILMCWTVREDNHPQATGKGRNAGYTVTVCSSRLFIPRSCVTLQFTVLPGIVAIRSAVNGAANRVWAKKDQTLIFAGHLVPFALNCLLVLNLNTISLSISFIYLPFKLVWLYNYNRNCILNPDLNIGIAYYIQRPIIL